MPDENMEAMMQAAGAEAGHQLIEDPNTVASNALEDISESLAEVDEVEGTEKVFTVVSELRGINHSFKELIEIAKKAL